MDEQTITSTEEVLETTEAPVEEVDSISSNSISIIEGAEPVLGEEVTEVSDEVTDTTE